MTHTSRCGPHKPDPVTHLLGMQVTVEAAGSEESDRAKVERMLQSLRKESGTLRVAPRGLQVSGETPKP